MPRTGRHWIEHDGRRRAYFLHAPPAYDGRALLPLVVMLHGAGGSSRWTADETRWTDEADRSGFVVAFPEGTPPNLGEPANFLHNPRLWNDGSSREVISRLGTDDVGFLVAMIDELVAKHSIDPRRAYATGFSNGAGMTFRLAAEAADRLAAIAPVASHCWLDDPRPAQPLDTMFVIGDHDPLVPLDGGFVQTPWPMLAVEKPPVRESLDRWARAIGCVPPARIVDDADGLRREAYDAGEARAEFSIHTVAGLGHHWPGGRGQLNARLAGAPSNRLDATRAIWEFFARRRM